MSFGLVFYVTWLPGVLKECKWQVCSHRICRWIGSQGTDGDQNGWLLNRCGTVVLRLQTIKTIVNNRKFKGSSYDEHRRVQVLDLYCLTRFESENSRRGDVD